MCECVCMDIWCVCVCGCACYGNILGNYAYQNQTFVFACIVYENVRGRDMHTHTQAKTRY